MFIEAWERLRGLDKWVETEASVRSSELTQVQVGRTGRYGDGDPIYEWQSFEELAWRDETGAEQKERLSAHDGSPLFQLYDGKSVKIRYNPAKPYEFYIREEFLFNLRRRVIRGSAVVVGCGVILAIGILFHRR